MGPTEAVTVKFYLEVSLFLHVSTKYCYENLKTVVLDYSCLLLFCRHAFFVNSTASGTEFDSLRQSGHFLSSMSQTDDSVDVGECARLDSRMTRTLNCML